MNQEIEDAGDAMLVKEDGEAKTWSGTWVPMSSPDAQQADYNSVCLELRLHPLCIHIPSEKEKHS